MNRLLAIVLLTFSGIAFAQTPQLKSGSPKSKAEKQETSHLAFVTEYVRELSAIENIRASAEQDQTQGTNNEKFSNAIYSSKRMQFELRLQINILKQMHLDPPFETLIPNLVNFNESKVELFPLLSGLNEIVARQAYRHV